MKDNAEIPKIRINFGRETSNKEQFWKKTYKKFVEATVNLMLYNTPQNVWWANIPNLKLKQQRMEKDM